MSDSKKILIAFFSRGGMNYTSNGIADLQVGNTEKACMTAAELTGAEMFKIEPVKPYPFEYSACTDAAQKELRANARPEITKDISIDSYDVIILAYPNWWGTMPMPVWTFLDAHNWNGKTIMPLCTNEGSGMGSSERDLKKLVQGAEVKAGLPLYGSEVSSSKLTIEKWLKSNGVL